MVSIPVRSRNPQEESPPNSPEFRIVDEIQSQESDHETDEATRRRMEAWSVIAANLTGGFTQMPDFVRKSSIGSNAKLVYEHLLSYMRQKDHCWPSQKRIAQELGISRRTVIRACQELQEHFFVEKYRRGQGKTNYYFINPLSFFLYDDGKPLNQLTLRLSEDMSLAPTSSLADLYGMTFYADVAPQPQAHTQEKCQNVTSRSANVSHPEVTKCHTKYTKVNDNKVKDTDTYSRSAEGASSNKEEFDAAETIRSTTNTNEAETGTKAITEAETNELNSENRNTVAFEERPAAPAPEQPAQEAPKPPVKPAKATKKEPEPPCPYWIEKHIRDLSERFGDQHLKSSITQAARLYRRARVAAECDEYDFVSSVHALEPHWIAAAELATVAKLQRPGEYGIKTIVNGRKNAMPWFFKYLRSLVEGAEQGRAEYDAAMRKLQAEIEEAQKVAASQAEAEVEPGAKAQAEQQAEVPVSEPEKTTPEEATLEAQAEAAPGVVYNHAAFVQELRQRIGIRDAIYDMESACPGCGCYHAYYDAHDDGVKCVVCDSPTYWDGAARWKIQKLWRWILNHPGV